MVNHSQEPDLTLVVFESALQLSFTFEELMNFPSEQQRIAIVGATGSGKTHAALWHLSRRDFDLKPWLIYDYKFDDLINSIEGIRQLEVSAAPPTEPGLYVIHPEPETDDEKVEVQMRAIWRQEEIGVYVDEGYMVGNRNSAFRALLTQGRSKHIPMIVLSQRPVWMDKFVFTESDFFQVFRLQSSDDINAMEKFIPYDLEKRLPPRNSYYYDVSQNQLSILRPVPDRKAILATFNSRLEGMVHRV